MVLGGIEGRGVILQEEGERSGALLARRAPTIRMCLLDARMCRLTGTILKSRMFRCSPLENDW